MNWTHIILLGILVGIAVVIVCTQKREQFLATVVGGIVASKIIFDDDHSTVVRKLLGDQDKTIVLLHNAPFNMEVWDPLYMYVQGIKNAGGKIPNFISYDLLGWGTGWATVDSKYNDGDPKNHAWSFKDYIDGVYTVYQRYVGSGKITLVGYGFGGSVAQAFALEHSNVIDDLYILSTTIGPTVDAIPDEIQYLVGWIAKNPLVPFLTMEQKFVQQNLCLWFQNNNPAQCPNPENRQDRVSTFNTVEFLLASKMFREASCQSTLQVDKLLEIEDLRTAWKKATVTFPVTFIVGNRDHSINFDTLKEDMQLVTATSPKARLYIVDGKHGFTLMNSPYIYQLITGRDMSGNPLTLETT